MGVEAVALIPASPLLVPALTPHLPDDVADDAAALRGAARTALAPLADVQVAIVVVPGRNRLVTPGRTALDGFGLVGLDHHLPGDGATAADLGANVGVDVVPGDLTVEGSLIGAVLAAVAPARAVVTWELPPGIDPIGAAEALAVVPASCAVVGAGDLSPCLTEKSPGYLVDGAIAWDREVVNALGGLDLEALDALSADALRVRAPGWPAPVIAARLAAVVGLAPSTLTYRDARGVGRVVAAWQRA